MQISVIRTIQILIAVSLSAASFSHASGGATPSPHSSSRCTTVFDCAQAAVQAAQDANLAADRASLALPIGTVIAFAGTQEQAFAQRQNGWWIANGDTVTDSASVVFFEKKLPDLTSTFLYGAGPGLPPGKKSGAPNYVIKPNTITTETTGFDDKRSLHQDPRTNIYDDRGWTTGAPITASGPTAPITVDTLPPYYVVIYLIKVR